MRPIVAKSCIWLVLCLGLVAPGCGTETEAVTPSVVGGATPSGGAGGAAGDAGAVTVGGAAGQGGVAGAGGEGGGTVGGSGGQGGAAGAGGEGGQGGEGPCVPEDEVCDGVDNDCDDAIDEDLGTTTCGAGICQVTVPTCEAGELVPCLPSAADPPEDCDGLDDNCDGVVDEGCTCINGAQQPCYTGAEETRNVGECYDGKQTCALGLWGACLDDQVPASEICDSLDNDCDGTADEDDPEGGTSCDTGLSGVCAPGVWHCNAGDLECVQNVQPSAEICDGLDNDCVADSVDGVDDPVVGTPCDGADADLCEEGVRLCVAGQIQCSDTTGNSLDVCDGVDNDCDPGSADGAEDPQSATPCDGVDSDLCVEGTLVCVAGSLACSDTTGGTIDTCDGVDNDCDGTSDDGSEDPLVNTVCDGPDGDLCEEGTRSCVNGSLFCSDVTGNVLDLCDGFDNDCDPVSLDGAEDPQVGTVCDGPDSDLCTEGTRACVNGSLQCSDDSLDTLDLCDGVNNDCDAASADGSEDPQNGQPCDGPDSDLCTEGTRACVTGNLVCSDTTGDTRDVCDGFDNDCDPASADGAEDALVGVACDGPDSDLCTEGTRACVSGSLACSDTSTNTLDICNGLDDDCDAASPDGSEDSQVGIACDGTDVDMCPDGLQICTTGSVVCNDGPETGLDICDGVDNDCNSATADGSQDVLVGQPCDGSDADLCVEGSYSCTGGVLLCSDTTGTTYDVCDGADNDCNPATEDGSQDTLVGQACDGADSDLCKEGTSACQSGSVVCSDTTGSTTDVCNGLDDDCDPASADGTEDPSFGQACDGPDGDLCVEGTRVCSGGALSCNDTTGTTTDVCNNNDDDCDPTSADGSEDPLVGLTCDGADTDLCKEGSTQCSGGTVVCSDTTASTTDLCNGLDDDCDPASADGAEDPLVGATCDGPDSDLCYEGTRQCLSGAVTCSDTTGSTLDVCNGLNDDCDAASADGSEDPLVGVACDGPDSDLCTEGTGSCNAGSVVCSDTSASTLDLCNGADDDCDPASGDGTEDPLNGAACDGPDSDLCYEGLQLCVSGGLQCSDGSGSTLDVCNGLNDDCDAASADGAEDPLVGIACDGPDSDLCTEGTSSCSSGSVVCSDTSGDDVEICYNGLDDDCSGVENNGCCAGSPIQIPLGATSVSGDTCGGTNNYAATCAGGAASPDVIYIYTAPATGTATFSTCGGAAFDTALHARTDCATPGSQVACIDDGCGVQGTISFAVTAGNSYYVIMDGYGSGSCGAYTMYITDPCDGPEDCPSTTCAPGTCSAGACSSSYAPAGTPCSENGGIECDGAGNCVSCGVEPTPPGGSCPAECTGGCASGTCYVDCSGGCATGITCPAGFACQVNCPSGGNCSGIGVNCPSDYACDIYCGANNACLGTIIGCSTGTCELHCDVNNACRSTVLNCGDEECSSICTGSQSGLVVNPGSSCACSNCGLGC